VNDEGARVLHRLVSAYHDGRTLALLLDYDGTLAPIVEHPRLALLSPEKRRLLERLAALPRLAVGVLSGRSLSDVTSLVGVPGLYYAGTGGMEIDLRGRRLRHPKEREGAALITSVAQRLADIPGRWPGAWIERKPVGLTVHYRAVAADRIEELIGSIGTSLGPWRTRLTTVGGPMAIEVVPRDGWTKGAAVQIILDHVGQDAALPVYAGDDANDADALALVAARGGIPIGVGPEAPPEAACRLPDPAAMVELLAALLKSLTVSERGSRRATRST
jgi:trehalose-phosphatase